MLSAAALVGRDVRTAWDVANSRHGITPKISGRASGADAAYMVGGEGEEAVPVLE